MEEPVSLDASDTELFLAFGPNEGQLTLILKRGRLQGFPVLVGRDEGESWTSCDEPQLKES